MARQDKEVTIYLHTKNCVHFAGVPMLKPGANTWPRLAYSKAKRTEAFKNYVKAQKITVDEEHSMDPTERDLDAAVAHVREMMDVKQLRRALETEKRDEVKTAILDQIEKLESPPPETEGQEDGEKSDS